MSSDRLIAIGDIHGCSAALEALIRAIGPGPGDTVVTLGDYIDRGPDSRGVLDRLIELAGACRLVPLLGNHDQMLLDAISEPFEESWSNPALRLWLDCGGLQTLDSYGPSAQLADIDPGHLEFLGGCRDHFETDTHIFVHANYVPHLAMAEQDELSFRWRSLRDSTPAPHRSGKVVVVGHTSQKSGEPLDLGHLKCIDTYCYGGGWLTALEVRTGRLWQADRRGRMRPPGGDG